MRGPMNEPQADLPVGLSGILCAGHRTISKVDRAAPKGVGLGMRSCPASPVVRFAKQDLTLNQRVRAEVTAVIDPKLKLSAPISAPQHRADGRYPAIRQAQASSLSRALILVV